MSDTLYYPTNEIIMMRNKFNRGALEEPFILVLRQREYSSIRQARFFAP